MKPHGTSTFLSRNNFISVTLTDSPPCPLTPSWSASVTPPPIYQTALIGPITFKHIQE